MFEEREEDFYPVGRGRGRGRDLQTAIENAIDAVLPSDGRRYPLKLEDIEVVGSRESPGRVHEYRVTLSSG